MAAQRVSRLQKRVLRLLMTSHQHTQGGTSRGHLALVKTLGGDQRIISHSLRTLETRGGLLIGRLRGGQAVYLHLTPEGVEKASEICTKL